MKCLLITQSVNQEDPVLGFFHAWIEEFARNFERVNVICLSKGKYQLPSNVSVYSLGKEEGVSKLTYLYRFYKYIWQLRKDYDLVFVHMNQEYVLLGWKSWLLLGKRIYLWRNHAKGSLLTDLAVFLSYKVFYTSAQSYTAKFKKALKMPAGIDTEFFKPDPAFTRTPHSALFLGRISPVKKVLEFIEWAKAGDWEATLAGPILAKDREYAERVMQALTPKIKFIGPVNQEGARKLYLTHETYVNFTPAGSFDKTIIEAAACGMKLEVSNPDLQNFKVEDHSLKKLMSEILKEVNPQ